MRGKVIVISKCIKNEEKPQFNNLNAYLKELNKGQENKPQKAEVSQGKRRNQ